MEKMENQMQAMDDKPVDVGKAKKPYETPKLLKLGTVKELTEGFPLSPDPDVGQAST